MGPTQHVLVYTESYAAGNGSVESRLRAVQARYPLQHASVAGQLWTWRRTGASACPLLLLPGIQTNGDTFFELADLLGETFDLVLATPPPITDAMEMVASVKGLLGVFGASMANIYGSSLGGYFAQAFAVSAPTMVRQLFLANTFFDATFMQDRLPSARDIEESDASKLTTNQAAVLPTDDEGQTALRTFTLLQPQDGAMLKARTLALVYATPLPIVPVPEDDVVIIDDDNDSVMPAPMRHAMRERYAACLQICIQGGGHQPAVQRPHTVAALLRHRLKV